jgi:hypothetical protein
MQAKPELAVIAKTCDLVLWSCRHIGRFPRQHRFVLGERLAKNLYDLPETLVEARYTKERQARLFREHPFRRAAAEKPSVARRVVPQPTEERPLGPA